MSDKLKPCPFCGSESAYKEALDNHNELSGEHFIYCTNENTCGAELGWKASKEDAMDAWNRRACKCLI